MPKRRRLGAGWRWACARMALLALAVLFLFPSVCLAEERPLALEPFTTFAVSGSGSALRLHGALGSPLTGVSAQVQVVGPGRPSAATENWPVTAELTADLGDLQGTVDISISLPEPALPAPGAYEARVTLLQGGAAVGSYSTWVAAVAADQPPISLALVFPLMRGVRQDPSGVFTDAVIRETAASTSDSGLSLYALVSLLSDFPSWRFTMAVEPVLLSQLRDQADGFSEISPGAVVEYAADSAEARQAAEALTLLKGLARGSGVELIPTPYASPSLPLLAGQGWDDGTEQMRLGKAEFQALLEPAETPRGTYAPGLDLATNALASFSQASIDYVVASAAVIRDLAEQPGDTLLPVRISDSQNNRITLLPVSDELSAPLSGEWDVPRFFAAIASLLADGGRTALIAAPADEYAALEPADLQAVGEGLAQAGFITTATLADVLQSHPPRSRPIFLSRFGGYASGLMSQVLLEEVGRARQVVDDLASAAGEDATAVSAARLALFKAESRFWFREGTDPSSVNVGLGWARAAVERAEGQLGAVSIGKVRAARDGEGVTDIAVWVRSDAGSNLSLLFEVLPQEGGEPLTSTGQAVLPGESVVRFQSSGGAGDRYLLRVSAGATQLALVPFEVRPGWLPPLWVWIALGVLLAGLAAAAYFWRWRGRRPAPPQPSRRSVAKTVP